MKRNRFLKSIISVFLLFTVVFWTQPVNAQITEKPEFGLFAITNVTIHTVTQGVIEGGVVVIENGKIAAVGKNVKLAANVKRIDASGKHLYPGFIDSGTFLGLLEIGAVAVTNDQRELGSLNPNTRAFTAINPNSANIPVTRVNGVTSVVSHPTGGLIAGKATLINLFGYTPDSMAVVQDAALVIEWPTKGKRGWWDNRDEKEIEKAYNKALKELNDFWSQASFYHTMMSAYEANPKGKTKPDRNVKHEAMRDVFSGRLPVMINVDREKAILSALDWIKKQDDIISFMLSSVAEGWRVADKIAKAKIPVLVGPTLRTPSRNYDNYQRPYQNAGLLHKAGVMVAIRTGETENVRNLNFNAGYAATYGLGKEEALKAVTINPAKIFGVDDKIGSIEVGKVANLMITDGDPFETITTIEQVFISGYKIPMINRQTELYDEFIDRADVRQKR